MSKNYSHGSKLKRHDKMTKHKSFSTSKLILLGMILLCLQIVFFCEYAMLTLGDTSAMYVLIGIPAALAPIIWGYYGKSKAENVAGGIVYESAMAEMRSNKHEATDSTAYESDTVETRSKGEGGCDTNGSSGDAAG